MLARFGRPIVHFAFRARQAVHAYDALELGFPHSHSRVSWLSIELRKLIENWQPIIRRRIINHHNILQGDQELFLRAGWRRNESDE